MDRVEEGERLRRTKIKPYALFPLDLGWIYSETGQCLLNRPRPELGEHLGWNDFLIAVPQPRRPSEARPMFTTSLFDLHLHDRGFFQNVPAAVWRFELGGYPVLRK